MMVGRRRLIDALLLASVAAACGSAAREPAASRTPDGEVLPGRPRRVTFVAHRGGIVAGHPENTTDAFRQAIRHGVDAIEIDLRATSDGQIIVMHDETVDRTTDGRGAVADFTLAELKTLDAGRGQRIPTYEELLELVAGTEVSLLLDIKEGGTLDTREVVRLTREHDAAAGVIVGARTLDDLRAFHEIDSTLRTLGFVAAVEDVEASARPPPDEGCSGPPYHVTVAAPGLCWSMPTALRIEAYRFFFYAGDARERMHIHVRRNRKEAKFWLEPICLARNCGFSAHELNRIEHLAARHAQTVMDAWHDYFGP